MEYLNALSSRLHPYIMLPRKDLRKISENRLRDAGILIKNKRYSAAVYMAGYSVELKLKLRICEYLKFRQGFPENETEFITYQTASNQILFKSNITRLRQLKNHNLNDLLRYSGKQLDIITNFSPEWSVIKKWSPQQRYSTQVIRKAAAVDFIRCCTLIIEYL